MCTFSSKFAIGEQVRLDISDPFTCDRCSNQEGFVGTYQTIYLGHFEGSGALFDKFEVVNPSRTCKGCGKTVTELHVFCPNRPSGFPLEIELLSSSGLGRLPFKEETAGSNPASSTVELATNRNIERGH